WSRRYRRASLAEASAAWRHASGATQRGGGPTLHQARRSRADHLRRRDVQPARRARAADPVVGDDRPPALRRQPRIPRQALRPRACFVAMAGRNHVEDLRGASRLAVEATRGVTDLVEAVHRKIASGPGLLKNPLEAPVRAISGLVYGS